MLLTNNRTRWFRYTFALTGLRWIQKNNPTNRVRQDAFLGGWLIVSFKLHMHVVILVVSLLFWLDILQVKIKLLNDLN